MLPPFRPPCAEGLVVRRSHKSNLIHPALVSGTEQHELVGADGSAELAAEAVEVHLRAGDALLFVDCAPPTAQQLSVALLLLLGLLLVLRRLTAAAAASALLLPLLVGTSRVCCDSLIVMVGPCGRRHAARQRSAHHPRRASHLHHPLRPLRLPRSLRVRQVP